MEWNKNKSTSIICLIFSIVILVMSYNIQTPPSATTDYLGPKGVPIIISVLLLVSSIGIFFIKETSENENEEVGLLEILNLLPFLCVLIIFILLTPYIGMVLGLFLLMVILISITEKGHLFSNIIISGGVALAIWIIFEFVLKIYLPAWPIFFK